MCNVNISKLFKSTAVSAVYIVSMLLFMTLVSSDVFASSTGATSILPYESWLISFQKSMTGPVAFSVALLGIVGSGFALIFMGAELNRFIRTIIYLILVMTCLIGANAMMTDFFNGASIGHMQPNTENAANSVKPDAENKSAHNAKSDIESKASNRHFSTSTQALPSGTKLQPADTKLHSSNTLQAISQPQYALQPILPVNYKPVSLSYMSHENLEPSDILNHKQVINLKQPFNWQKQNQSHTDSLALQKQNLTKINPITLQTQSPLQRASIAQHKTNKAQVLSAQPPKAELKSDVKIVRSVTPYELGRENVIVRNKSSQYSNSESQPAVTLGCVNMNDTTHQNNTALSLEQSKDSNFIRSLMSGDDSQEILLWQSTCLSNIPIKSANLSAILENSQ